MKKLVQQPWWIAAVSVLLGACAADDQAGSRPVEQRVEGSCTPTSAGEFVSTAVSDASSLCVNVVDASSSDGAGIEVYTCTGYGSESFRFSPTDTGQYRIQNVLSGLCLDIGPSSTSGGQVVQRACVDGAQSQSFVLAKAGNGSYSIRTGDGAGCMAVRGTANKSSIETVACSDVAEQRFAIMGAPGSTSGSTSGPTEGTPSGGTGGGTSGGTSGGSDDGGAASACNDGVPDGNHPSGQAPPNCSPPGFTLARVDDMLDNSQGWDFPGDFQYYSSYIKRANTSIHDGILDMHASFDGAQGSAGWALNKSMVQTYGKFLVRMRGDRATNLAEAPLLWPQSENWPGDGEIDFAEDDFGDRTCYAFSHYANASGNDAYVMSGPEQGHSLADWHTWGVEWTPDALRYTVDGVVWDTVTQPEAIPRNPMWIGFVQSCLFGACDANMDAHWEIDWVATYSYSP